MPIPTYEEAMLPVLLQLSDGLEYKLKSIYQTLADQFKLSEEEMNATTPSGQAKLFNNRVAWAVTYLKKSELIASPKYATYVITQRGHDVLKTNPGKITYKLLMKYPEFIEFWRPDAKHGTSKVSESSETILTQQKTPQELMDECYTTLRKALADDLLQQVGSQSPTFFERLVLDLLVRMGYGGSREDAAQVVGKSGDEGIDGIIKEDRLGLDVIYVQAKRWKTSVGSPEIQSFIGALKIKGAHKGIFITTSAFTKAARELALKVDTRIVLIDGMQLAQLMIDFGIGVSTEISYDIKRIDIDYFVDE